MEVQYIIVEKKGGAPFFDIHLLDIFSCEYISISISDQLSQTQTCNVCTCNIMAAI